MLRKFYVGNMDRIHHLGDLGSDGRIKFYARIHGVTSRKTLSAVTSKKTSHLLSD
jgi:hypothetical protein